MKANRAALGRSWKAPLIGGLVALAMGFVLCAGIVVLSHHVFPAGDPNGPRQLRQFLPAGQGDIATWYAFQRVPMNIELRESTTETVNSRFEDPERGHFRVVVSPLGGLLLVGLTLIAGGALAWKKRDPERDAVAGPAIRMAAVFAVASFALSFVLPLAETVLEPGAFARRSTMLTYEPSHLGAFVWPFVWALTFGSLGMHIGRHGRDWRRQLFARIAARTPDGANALRAALSGLAVGSILVIVAGLTAAGVAIVQHPAGAGAVLGSGRNVAGIAEGMVLGLPHATGAGLLGSMGVPARYEMDLNYSEGPTKGSLGIFGGTSGKPHGSLSIAVPQYALGGLAVAAVLVVVTGFRAAAGAGGRGWRAIRASFMSAGLLTLFLWVIAYLVGGRARMLTGVHELTEVHGSIGASPLALLFLPLVWTFGGGLVGALFCIRGSRAGEREPASASGIGRSSSRRVVSGAAAAALVAVTAGFAVAARVLDDARSITAGPAGQAIYRDPTNGWRLQFPDSWYAQPFSEHEDGSPYDSDNHGILISNIPHRFEHPREEGISWTPWFDMRGLPSTLVAVQVGYIYSGGFVITGCDDTPLPLSLNNAERTVANEGANGTPQTKLSLPFIMRRIPLYSVNAWIGSDASEIDLATLNRIVASIAIDGPGPSASPHASPIKNLNCFG